MYILRKLPYLDQPTGNYLLLLETDQYPTIMKPYIQTIHPPQNSPFEIRQCGCVNIMTDISYTSTHCRTNTSSIAQSYLQLTDLGHAIRLWRENGFTLDKNLTEVMREHDTRIIGVFI